jgi:Tfp pilus assembly protein FimT
MPCLPRTQRGLAKLEFAVSVAVIGVLVALALGALSRLQLLGDEAQRLTRTSLQATASAVQAAMQTTPQTTPQTAPCADLSSPTPQPGTAASTPIPPRSCP